MRYGIRTVILTHFSIFLLGNLLIPSCFLNIIKYFVFFLLVSWFFHEAYILKIKRFFGYPKVFLYNRLARIPRWKLPQFRIEKTWGFSDVRFLKLAKWKNLEKEKLFFFTFIMWVLSFIWKLRLQSQIL